MNYFICTKKSAISTAYRKIKNKKFCYFKCEKKFLKFFVFIFFILLKESRTVLFPQFDLKNSITTK